MKGFMHEGFGTGAPGISRGCDKSDQTPLVTLRDILPMGAGAQPGLQRFMGLSCGKSLGIHRSLCRNGTAVEGRKLSIGNGNRAG